MGEEFVKYSLGWYDWKKSLVIRMASVEVRIIG